MPLWWIFRLSQKICRAVRDRFPACCHPPVSHFDTRAANIPQFISIFSDYFGPAALALLLFRHLFIDSLTHADRQILTWETSQVSCEWIWMEASICPSAIRPHWKPERWQHSARGWRESENELDVTEALTFFPGEKQSASKNSFSRIYTPCKAESGGVKFQMLAFWASCQYAESDCQN